MLVFAGLEPGGLGNMGLAGVLVAPSTGEVLEVISIDRSPAYAPIFLHRDLWAGEIGQVINGIMAAASMILLSIGIYLWWPRSGRVFRKMSPRPWRTTFSHASRLHDWTGVWMLLALFTLAASGLCLVQPGWVEPALGMLPDGEKQTHVEGACGAPIGFDAALESAHKLVPNGTWTAVYPHDEEFRAWEIAMRTGGDADTEHGDVRVLADLQCGAVSLHDTADTLVRPATRRKRGLQASMTARHSGQPVKSSLRCSVLRRSSSI